MRGAVETVAVARDVASSSPSKPAAAALDMMRYQRSNPECLPLPNGIGSGSGGTRKPQPPAAPAPRSSKDEAASAVATDSSRLAAYLASTSLEPKQRARAPQPPAPTAPSSSVAAAVTRSPARDHGHHPSDLSDPSSPSYLGGGGGASSGSASPAGAGGEVLLQWGHNKRTRGRRDAPAGAASPLRRQPGAKIPRRSSAPDKLMPPPSGPSYTRGSNLRVASTPPARGGDAHHGRGSLPHHHRSAEERAGGKAKAEKQRPDAAVMGLMVPNQKQMQQAADHLSQQQQQQQQNQGAAASSSKPKLEMPRIYTTLSRKEKEEDFLAMKGTKLPVRPKKRPKTVEKAVNFICPGMWLTDVTRNRYEVREKKCPKKQRNRGLKGMESMDSDSD